MPPDPMAPLTDPDRHGRRAVWIAALITIIGAGMIYADKAAEDRSAFIRWRHQVLEMMAGANIYDEYFFPNPPIMPLTLYPLMVLPPVLGAVCWFAIKAVLAGAAVLLCMRMVRLGDRPIPSWVQAMVVLLSLRPIMSDLHHGNNNILILFLVTATLAAWRKGYDVLAGLILAYAIAFKVTPGLFLLYFAYKRSWRTVGTTVLGMGIFLLIIPSLFLGPEFNGICLGTWWNRILSPYVESDIVGPQEINQSMVGVLTRLMIETKGGVGLYALKLHVNLVAWNPKRVVLGIKLLSIGMLGLLAWLCRTRAERRDDPRLFGEFALIVLAMLFVSERSWKHHFVTLLLPYTYLAYRVGVGGLSRTTRYVLGGALVASALMMATTSTELGGLFAKHQGHKIAQAYGMFLWAGVVLFIATAWRVRVEGQIPAVALGLQAELPPADDLGSHPTAAKIYRGPHQGACPTGSPRLELTSSTDRIVRVSFHEFKPYPRMESRWIAQGWAIRTSQNWPGRAKQMNPSNPKARRTRSATLSTETLEKREMMTGGVGDTFAILPSTIKTANGHTTVSFALDPKLFTDTKKGNKSFVLGIDVASASSGQPSPSSSQ